MARDNGARYNSAMNRRFLLTSALAFPLAARAETTPWQARLLRGGFDGKVWRLGLQVMLQPGWKTYWRVPGSGGIAPAIEVTGSNIKSVDVFHPLPQRLKAGEDDVIGYKDDVVFPLTVELQNAADAGEVRLNAFLGVCDTICIPARFEQALQLEMANAQGTEATILAQWLAKVPTPVTGLVQRARPLLSSNGKIVLAMNFSEAVLDVFVEGSPLHYFHPPLIKGLEGVAQVNGVKAADELLGQSLRLTVVTASGGVEQTVTVG